MADVVAAYSNLPYPHKSTREFRKILDSALDSARTETPVSPVHKLRRRLGPERAAAVVAAYSAGQTIRQLSTDFQASGDALLRLLREEGVEIRSPRVLTPDQVGEIVRRYEAGESTYEIEKATGIPKTTVARTLQRAGIQLRRRGRPPLR